MNTKNYDCEYCGEGDMVEEIFFQTIRHGRSNLKVEGLLQYRCDVCDTVMTTPLQFESNAKAIETAERQSSGYISVGMLRQFREKYSLTQKVAGLLVGAGEAAFGKYETGAHPSTPTAKLIRVALAVPGVVDYLAYEEGLVLDSRRELEDRFAQQTNDFESTVKAWKTGKFMSVYHPSAREAIKCTNDVAIVVESMATNNHWQKRLAA